MTVPDFDYTARPQQKLEIPLAERIAAIRARKAEERARAALKNARTHGPKAGMAHGPRPSSHGKAASGQCPPSHGAEAGVAGTAAGGSWAATDSHEMASRPGFRGPRSGGPGRGRRRP